MTETTHPELSTAWELFDSGDQRGAMRTLRLAADSIPPAELAPLVAKLAESSGFEDLRTSAAGLVARPDDATALYAFGYDCIERGVSALAVPALRASLDASQRQGRTPRKSGRWGRKPAPPDVAPRKVLVELAVALEDGERHAEAADVLSEHDTLTEDWPDGYLLAYNALMAGRVDQAARVFGALAAAPEQWQPAAERIARILARVATAAPEGDRDLRGWHFALTGGLLSTLSPYGFTSMTGRWAYLQDTRASCRLGLERLRTVLAATGRTPASVGLLPDRNSEVLGLAAAEVLGLPAEPYRPGAADVLVVAYDLNECDRQLVVGLRERVPGQVLFEHATCWTDPPAVSADVSTLLVQTVVAPWGERMRFTADGERDDVPADERPAEEVAAEIVTAEPRVDEGDGEAPADSAEALSALAERVREEWLTGPRDRARSSGPVRSGRFA
ncbi:hypothetical protein [Actinacidiphila acidipaludis]|uniref:Tetratricopeptide repeat protein n=1 Tax=Actinacidiphila acidipaludis TaxID=2873382 RepID=A0ABS7Q6B8_9ACTN|nr:hypothetical protein [Streptomyces acidipaludis]MBY8877995.1 hypothetical protein [Streptomyces acidipaludis]